jgi:2-dehydro-3-deoxyphosphogluconate aldolase/(4S)-4-hydroxy-2-oxoglutarate aldolase
MNEQKFSWELFYKIPIIGIVRNLNLDQLAQILPLYLEAGLSTVEITMNTEGVEDLIKYAVATYGATLNVGAGTVCNKKDLKKALTAGAQFIVTPIVRRKLIRYCVDIDVPIFPGACTPTEIYKAWRAGASMVKMFPAKTLGPGFLKDVKAPLDEVKLLPTGGIDLDNIGDFKKAGADGYGVGSPLFRTDLIKAQDWNGLQEHFTNFAGKVKVL